MNYKDKIDLIKSELTNEVPNLDITKILNQAKIGEAEPVIIPRKKPIFQNLFVKYGFALVIVLIAAILFFNSDFAGNHFYDNSAFTSRNRQTEYDYEREVISDAFKLYLLTEKNEKLLNSNETKYLSDISQVEFVNAYLTLSENILKNEKQIIKSGNHSYHINGQDIKISIKAKVLSFNKSTYVITITNNKNVVKIEGTVALDDDSKVIDLAYNNNGDTITLNNKITNSIPIYTVTINNNENLMANAIIKPNYDNTSTAINIIDLNSYKYVYQVYLENNKININCIDLTLTGNEKKIIDNYLVTENYGNSYYYHKSDSAVSEKPKY